MFSMFPVYPPSPKTDAESTQNYDRVPARVDLAAQFVQIKVDEMCPAPVITHDGNGCIEVVDRDAHEMSENEREAFNSANRLLRDYFDEKRYKDEQVMKLQEVTGESQVKRKIHWLQEPSEPGVHVVAIIEDERVNYNVVGIYRSPDNTHWFVGDQTGRSMGRTTEEYPKGSLFMKVPPV